jgi:S1-C subfamily serine protease
MPAARPHSGLVFSLFFACSLVAQIAAGQTVESLPAPPRAVTPGYFGVLALDAPDGNGAILRDVVAGSPADAAGLQPRDVITHVGDAPIGGALELIEALRPFGPGERISLAVIQSGFQRDVEVTLGERPAPERRPYADFGRVALPRQSSGASFAPTKYDTLLEDNTPLDARLGLRTVAATQAALARRGLPDRPGALVMRVERDSPADLAGIPMSSLIVSANGESVTSPQSLALALTTAGGDVQLTYCIGAEERTCRVIADR